MASANRGSVVESVQRLFGSGGVTTLDESQLLERFVAHGDQSAFEAILLRHGSMVLGVCRRVLDDPHDVDDAFQATFLILVKKAASIYGGEVLGTWLYGVARRVAIRARMNARLRQARERAGAEEADVRDLGVDRVEAKELRSLIDDELERLPARYRAPVVLCDLEGHTHDQAAAQLRCPVGTVKSRLSRGREKLRERLVRRGIAPSVGLLAATAAAETTTAVPLPLIEQTIGAASKLAAGGAISAGAFSAEITALMKGVLRSMLITKLKISAIALTGTVLTVAAAWALVGRAIAQTPRGGADRVAGTPLKTNQSPPAGKALKNDGAKAQTMVPLGRAVTQFQLNNGLKVILRPIRGAKQTTLVVLYSLGNDHDPDGRTGLAHMIEHVYVTAATGNDKQRTVDEYLQRYPDGWNAQTGDRYTVFATVFAPPKLDDELRDAAARMNDLRITQADIDRERPRMLEEVGNMFGQFPPLAALNNAIELLRPTPGGGRRGGLPAHIQTITAEDVRSTWKRYYKPRNAILVMSGQLDSAAALKVIEAHFGKLEGGETAPAPRDPGKPKFGAIQALNVDSALPGAKPKVCLAYAAPQPGSELYAPFLVLSARLMKSAAKLGGEAGEFPVYFAMLDNPAVLALTSTANPGESSQAAVARLNAIVAETFSPKLANTEVSTAREEFSFLLGIADLADEMLAVNPYGVAFSLGRRVQLGLDSEALNRAMDAVTDADLRRVATDVFGPDKHTGAFITPEK